jgi:hypothetical protein
MAVDRSSRSPGSAGVPRDDDNASGDQRCNLHDKRDRVPLEDDLSSGGGIFIEAPN